MLMTKKNLFAKAAAAALALGLIGAVATPALAAPKATKTVPPEYPRGAERRGLEGVVTLEFNISADGAVSDVKVVAADQPGVFDEAAIAAVTQWQYEGGQATAGHRVEIEFAL
jgi:protein TonB